MRQIKGWFVTVKKKKKKGNNVRYPKNRGLNRI